MTFVCVEAGTHADRYVWCHEGRGHSYVRLDEHQRMAIAKIWQWCFPPPRPHGHAPTVLM